MTKQSACHGLLISAWYRVNYPCQHVKRYSESFELRLEVSHYIGLGNKFNPFPLLSFWYPKLFGIYASALAILPPAESCRPTRSAWAIFSIKVIMAVPGSGRVPGFAKEKISIFKPRLHSIARPTDSPIILETFFP